VFGLEAYTGPTNIEGSTARSQWKHHLTILAADDEGYRNLNRIVTQSYIDFHYHPTVGGRSLAEHAEGLVVLSGCSGSQLACALLGGKGTPEHIDDPDFEAARAVIERFVAVFGDNYYLEVQPFYELPRSCAMNTAYAELSHQTGVPLVVTHDVHYPAMADAEMQAVLHAVHRGKASVDDAMREWNYAVPLTLPETDAELVERLVKTGLTGRRAWSAVVTSGAIADRCNVTLPRADRLRYPATEEDMEPWV
jgi:DNA polymerase-3 subunit alpha